MECTKTNKQNEIKISIKKNKNNLIENWLILFWIMFITLPLIFTIILFILMIIFGIYRLYYSITDTSVQILYTPNTNMFNYKYEYLIRILYSAVSMQYNIDRTIITIELKNANNDSLVINVQPKIMRQLFIYKGMPCAKALVRTLDKLKDISTILIYHNHEGIILIHSIELQQRTSQNVYISYVKCPIEKRETMEKMHQPFIFGLIQAGHWEEDIWPSNFVTNGETVYFFYMALNIIFAVNMISIGQKCTYYEPAFSFPINCKMEKIFLFGATSFTIGYVLFLATIIPFRFFIKTSYRINRGFGTWKLIRFLYIITSISGIIRFIYTTEQILIFKFFSGLLNERISSVVCNAAKLFSFQQSIQYIITGFNLAVIHFIQPVCIYLHYLSIITIGHIYRLFGE